MLQELRQIRRLYITGNQKKEYSQFEKEQNTKVLEVKSKRPKLKTHWK